MLRWPITIDRTVIKDNVSNVSLRSFRKTSAPQQSLGGGQGGGIYAASDLTITDSVIENNTASGFSSGGGGGIYALGNSQHRTHADSHESGEWRRAVAVSTMKAT